MADHAFRENLEPLAEPGTYRDRALDQLRATWPRGPWDREPDRVEWRGPGGLPCLVTRNHHGALCGYVAVPSGHPLHGVSEDAPLEAHGSVTYAHACRGHVCHVPGPGESDGVWWFGFDCSHAWDLMPGLSMSGPLGGSSVYRDLPYVRGEVEALAQQLVAAAELAP